MIHYQKPIILMRPGASNERLAERLNKLGMNIWKWPAFTILPPADPERVREKLEDLNNFDMVLLASPAAVAAMIIPLILFLPCVSIYLPFLCTKILTLYHITIKMAYLYSRNYQQ